MNEQEMNEREARDSRKVDTAVGLIHEKKLSDAQPLLASVIANAPITHRKQVELEDKLFVKFWDQSEFVAFVQHHQGNQHRQQIIWIPNAYPRAYYWMAYLHVERGDMRAGLGFLDSGIKLEPTNPSFHIERAHILSRLNEHNSALEVYRSIAEGGLEITATVRARAFRGMGIEMIELGKLLEALVPFKESLEHDNSETTRSIVLRELGYIGQRLSGGPREKVTTIITKLATELQNE